jgi:hypothetical protein
VIGHSVALAVQAADAGGLGLTYAASGLPAGLAINPATGLISGTPTAAGTSTVTVSATDGFLNSAATQFSWTVIQPGLPFVTGQSLTGLKTRKAKLKLTVHAGSSAPALQAVKIALPGGLGFASKHKTLVKGISVKGAKFTAKLVGGKLVLTFAAGVQQVTIAIGPPATTETKALAAKAKHPKHKKLTVGVTAVDASGLATALRLKLPL